MVGVGGGSSRLMTRILLGLAVLLGACDSPQYEPCLTEGVGARCKCPDGEHSERKPGSTTLRVCTPDDDSVASARADAEAPRHVGGRDAHVDGDEELDGVEELDAAVAAQDAAREAAATCTPSAEVCNARDDDCDQAIDEDGVCKGHRLSAGGSYTCSVQGDGNATCWGENRYGTLGNGTDDTSTIPSKVMLADVASIAAATAHTCAIASKGEVSCWGGTALGRLGDGAPLPVEGDPKFRPTPKPVALPDVARDVTVGSGHSCAALNDGTVYCWGENDGRFGNGPGDASSTPVKVTALADVTGVAAGYDHTCAVLSSQKVYCWGNNFFGQLGDGTSGGHDTPIIVARLAKIVQLAADGNHTCALDADGGVQCWGYIRRTKRFRDSPEVISLSEPAVYVASGFDHDCAIGKSGGVWCWGANESGQLGDGTTVDSEVPLQVPGLSGPVELALGSSHTCARSEDGKVRCWGLGYWGALGDGTAKDRLTPTEVLFDP